jgi:hypothetical protein
MRRAISDSAMRPVVIVLPDPTAMLARALETAGLMLGDDKSRGYCLDMICADFWRPETSSREQF